MSALPSNRDENWKYAALRTLASARFDAPSSAETIFDADLTALPERLANYHRIVLIDGIHSHALSDTLPPGVTIKPVTMPADSASSIDDVAVDRRFSALNARHARECLHVDVECRREIAIEIVTVSATSASQGTSHPRVRIEVADGGRLSLVERHVSAAHDATLGNLVCTLGLGRDATAHIVRVQQLAPRAQWIETLDYQLGANAHCDVVHVSHGGVASRTTAFIDHRGRGAQLRWASAALGDASQVHDSYVRVNHAAREARTFQDYRGIASGRSRLAFNGHMHVAAGANDCASEQSLRCLLAGDQAEADVRPQLEIYTDAVRASHGATVGKLDADMKFYLASRGLEPQVAEALLKWAFVADVLARITPDALRRDVEHRLATQLPGAVPIGSIA